MFWERCSWGHPWRGSARESFGVPTCANVEADTSARGTVWVLHCLVEYHTSHEGIPQRARSVRGGDLDQAMNKFSLTWSMVAGWIVTTTWVQPLIDENEILHYGVRHRWLPCVLKLVLHRQHQNRQTTAVWQCGFWQGMRAARRPYVNLRGECVPWAMPESARPMAGLVPMAPRMTVLAKPTLASFA